MTVLTTTLGLLAQAEPGSRLESQVELVRWTVGAGLIVGVGLAAAATYAIWWFYGHEKRGEMGNRSRRGMTILRCAVLLILGLIGLEPVLARYLHRTIEATTVVLVDDSASMSVRDHYREPGDLTRVRKVAGDVPAEGVSRLDVARRLAARDGGDLVDRLANTNRVKVFRFSDSASPVEERSAASQPAEARNSTAWTFEATGSATDLGRSLRQAIESVAGTPISGVVLLSDGGLNYGESPDVVARFAQSRHVPIYAVGLGDPSDVINVRVTEVTGPRNAFAKDPFTVTVQVAAEGTAGEPLTLELVRRASGADMESAKLVERRVVRPKPDGTFEPQAFECRVDEAGPVVFSARVPALPFEATETDNSRETVPPVQVLDNKMRVLVVAGLPTYDYRYLVHLLERDETINVSCWLQSADVRAVRDGNTVLDHLPSTAQELYQYDVVILLDPDPSGLDAEWATRVASLVDDYGGGLLYQADTKWTTLFLRDPKMKPIVESLPIVPDREAELILNQLGQYQREMWAMRVPTEMVGSPLLRQAESPLESAQVWSALDGVYWHYPVRREKPAANVLLRHGNPRMVGETGPAVLYATQYVGAGRTAFVGFNSTWRWLRSGDQYFERFWVSAIRYLMEGKLLGGKKRGSLMTERDQFQVGETVVVTLRALDEKFEPLLRESLEMDITRGTDPARRIALLPIPGREGFYQGRFVVDRVGTLRLAVALPTRGGNSEPIQRDIVVNQADLELRRPVMRRDVLMKLADASGGRYFEVDEAGRLPDTIKDASVQYVLKERPIPLWDNPWVFGGLIVLLTIEWIWRKKAKLL